MTSLVKSVIVSENMFQVTSRNSKLPFSIEFFQAKMSMNTIIPIFTRKASSITVIKKSEWIYMTKNMAKNMATQIWGISITHIRQLYKSLKVPIDEAVANLRFDQTKDQTPDQLNQISLSGRDKVRESFQKYLEDQHNGMPIKTKILRQMAEAGEETVATKVEFPVVEIEQEGATAELQEVEIEHPDSIEEVSEGASASNKISEIVIIGMFFKAYI